MFNHVDVVETRMEEMDVASKEEDVNRHAGLSASLLG